MVAGFGYWLPRPMSAASLGLRWSWMSRSRWARAAGGRVVGSVAIADQHSAQRFVAFRNSVRRKSVRWGCER